MYDVYDVYDVYDLYNVYDLYDLAHVARWEPCNLHYLTCFLGSIGTIHILHTIS